MALVVNTNVASLVAQKNASDSASGLQQAMERLSSGQRINSAKDDSAGLAISNRMESLIRGFDAAKRNVNDGISMIQTAETSLSEINTIMQRMRELSVQAANGANSAADRVNLNSEFNSLKDQMNQIANTTTFNGKSLLTGEFYAQNVQPARGLESKLGLASKTPVLMR
jgi:Flagellin and related hook-associated proteins